MRALVLVVVLAVVGCKKKPAPEASGSAAAGSTVAIDAAAVAAVDAAAPDAAAAGITLTKDGFSSMPNYKSGDKPEDDVAKEIESKLAGVPGLAVSFDVMEYADEREEGYYSVKQGETEVAQLFRTEPDTVDVRVIGSMFPTTDGIKTGDKVSTLVAKYPDLTCEAQTNDELGLLKCKSPKAEGFVFVLDAQNYKGKKSGKLDVAKLADVPIYMIVVGLK